MNLTVFLGAPGSGKGTQARRLITASSQFLHFSTGDMLRTAISEKKPVGAKARVFMEQGELVPDAIILEMIEETLTPLHRDTRVILDGFPRTLAQATALDLKRTTRVNLCVYFQLPEKSLVSRIAGRITCERCEESYHLQFIPPVRAGICDKCQGTLVQRADDLESVALHRFEIWQEQNEALLKYYNEANRLCEVNADRDPDIIQQYLLNVLGA